MKENYTIYIKLSIYLYKFLVCRNQLKKTIFFLTFINFHSLNNFSEIKI